MNIFSLETIRHVLGWSAGLAIVLNNLISFKRSFQFYNCVASNTCGGGLKAYWPFTISYVNFIFWFLVILGILSLVRYYKNKKKNENF